LYNIDIGHGEYNIDVSIFRITVRNGKTRNFIGKSMSGVFIY
jgi:hypothetical protein